MHSDLSVLVLRNLFFLSLIAAAAATENMPRLQEELQRFWKTLTTPIVLKKTATNHKSNRFWEIDMTKFEP